MKHPDINLVILTHLTFLVAPMMSKTVGKTKRNCRMAAMMTWNLIRQIMIVNKVLNNTCHIPAKHCVVSA